MSRWLCLSIGLFAAALAAALYVGAFHFDELPDPMPTHWDIRGQPDAWMPRAQAFWMNFMLMPAVMAGFVVLTLALPWLSPKNFTIDTWRSTYDYVMAMVIALMGFIHVCLMLSSFHPEWKFVYFMVAGLLFFFALLGNVMGQVRKNFWVGVRTPWTLASDAVWIQTHRVAAWLWVGFGLIGALVVLLFRTEEVLIGSFVVLMIVAFAPVIYSLFLYKRLEKEGRL